MGALPRHGRPARPRSPRQPGVTMSMTRIPSLLLCLALAACGGQQGAEPSDATADDAGPIAAPDPGPRPEAANPAGNPEGEVPPGWQVRFDHDADYTVGTNPDSSDVFFVTMTPGWHITARPAGIYWHPASTASGAYRATAGIYLFPPGERNEGYGLFVGGADLDGADQAYVYFLVRRSGEFLVKSRMGEETRELIGWTPNEAIVPYTEETAGTIHNVLSVDVGADQVRFLVNDVEVAALPAADLPTDGVVGLRINHALNVHVDELSVTPADAM